MKINIVARCLQKGLAVIACLVLLLGETQPLSGLAAAPKMIFGSLHLMPLYLEKREICVGQKEKFSVLVVNQNSSNVPGATVHANDKTFPVGADGIARWSAIAEKAGQTTITIYATKPNYATSESFSTTVTVIDCTWNLRMDYTESYIDKGSTWVFEGSVEIEDATFGVNDDGTLSLYSGSQIEAQYRGTLYDLVKPMSCSPQPPLEGPYSITFKGKYSSGSLSIDLFAIPVQLPKMVTINCIAADPNYKIEPFKFATGQQLDLINVAQLTHISCPGDGCVRRFELSRLLLWPLKSPSFASGVLIIERVTK